MLVDQNIEHLMKNPFHWIGEVENNNYPKFLTKQDNIEYFENEIGEVHYIENKIDPNFIQNKYKKELLVVIGVSSIDEIKKIYKNKHKNSFMIVLEPRLSLFTYALNEKNMSIFSNKDIFLFADTHLENITPFLTPILEILDIISLVKNITFYITDYYRKYDLELCKNLLRMFRQGVYNRVDVLGNSVEDSLQGFEQYLDNINWIMRSKNPELLKDKFKDVPAILVAAGPSLNKNIQEIKKAQGKVIIIAVDTIIKRLIEEGITPHFVCSLERISQVYDYFFKNQEYPKEVTLVAPPLLDGRVFKSFKGEIVLPFREEVLEFRWLQNVLGIKGDIGMLMGISCANIAFGLAQHLGCSPIIFTGQDLAYGATEEETHASGTTYDDLEKQERDTTLDDIVEGYYGGEVKTTKLWMQFKLWFESQIQFNNIHAVNATEGGAKIYNTEQMTLSEAVSKYCTTEIPNVYEEIKNVDKYVLNPKQAQRNLIEEKVYFEDLLDKCQIQFNDLKDLLITAENFNKERINIQNYFYRINYIRQQITRHDLLIHALQSVVVNYLWESNDKDVFISVENLEAERVAQIKLVVPVMATLVKILKEIDDTIKELDQLVEV